MENSIEISGLTKKYGNTTVVDNLNLSIKKGEVFGLLGPNGAGKSTSIRMLLGLTEINSGSIRVCGFSPQSQALKVKEKVGYLPEDVGFYNNLTGRENLMLTARLNKIAHAEAEQSVRHLLNLVGLSAETDKKAGFYSRGMRQRLGLADVLIKKPDVIILDEPTLGLDPKGMKELLDKIKSLSQNDGITVLFSSHHLHQVQHICDRVGIFVKGKLIAAGDIQSLSGELFAESPMVIKAGITMTTEQDNSRQQTIEDLKKSINLIDRVSDVKYESDCLIIGCDRDISAEISKRVVGANVDLVSLTKKAYGLNDIYNKYFEGGGSDE